MQSTNEVDYIEFTSTFSLDLERTSNASRPDALGKVYLSAVVGLASLGIYDANPQLARASFPSQIPTESLQTLPNPLAIYSYLTIRFPTVLIRNIALCRY